MKLNCAICTKIIYGTASKTMCGRCCREYSTLKEYIYNLSRYEEQIKEADYLSRTNGRGTSTPKSEE